MTHLLYKLVNLTLFYDVRDDVELIWFTNLQEASLHILACNFFCQIEPIIYSILGLKKTEPKLGFGGKKTERLKGPKIQGPPTQTLATKLWMHVRTRIRKIELIPFLHFQHLLLRSSSLQLFGSARI